MNVFYLDRDPRICAEMHCDKHVCKMIIEYAQLMSTAHRVHDGSVYYDKTKNGRRIKRWYLNSNMEGILYKASHVNHPSAQWARASDGNYKWLYEMWTHLCEEYTHRYGKVHETQRKLADALSHIPMNIPKQQFKEPPQAMSHYPDCMVEGDSIKAYKNYYIVAKKEFAKWTKRQIPEWFQYAEV